jgi:NAD-dependent deacetylase
VIPEIIERLRSARHVAVLTGAGISAESGVPTFRDALTGLWEKFDPAELATPAAFANDPQLVWDWYEHRRQLCAAAEPNAGHRALAELERLVPRFTLTTQNVDDLHERAGSTNILRLHGSLFHYKCSRTHEPWEGLLPESNERPPRHPGTGHLLRPAVVWFNEQLPHETFAAAERAARSADVYFTIGTSAVVYPAAALPELALNEGATVIEINPTETDFSRRATFSLRGRAGEILPELVRLLAASP